MAFYWSNSGLNDNLQKKTAASTTCYLKTAALTAFHQNEVALASIERKNEINEKRSAKKIVALTASYQTQWLFTQSTAKVAGKTLSHCKNRGLSSLSMKDSGNNGFLLENQWRLGRSTEKSSDSYGNSLEKKPR